MSYLWIGGAAMALFGSCVTNAGVNIQKYSFIQNEKLPKEQRVPYTKQPYYYVGLGGVIAGSLGDFAALALAAQSIVAPMASATLVTNVLLAHFLLKEPLFRRDLVGTTIIILGCVLSVVFGDHSEQSYSSHQLLNFFSGYIFLIYVGCTSAFTLALYGIVKYVEPMKHKLDAEVHRYEYAVSQNDDEIALAADEAVLELAKVYKPWVKIHPFCYCALSGILGAQSILFGKMVSELLKTTITGDNQVVDYPFWVFLLSMGFFIASQLHFMALALSLFDALYVVPVFQCFFITVSTVGGATFFLEFERFDVTQAIIFPIGIFITLIGVYMLSSRAGQMSDQKEERRCSVSQRQALVSRVGAISRGRESQTVCPSTISKVHLSRAETVETELISEVDVGIASPQINTWMPATPDTTTKKPIKRSMTARAKRNLMPAESTQLSSDQSAAMLGMTDDGRMMLEEANARSSLTDSKRSSKLRPRPSDISTDVVTNGRSSGTISARGRNYLALPVNGAQASADPQHLAIDIEPKSPAFSVDCAEDPLSPNPLSPSTYHMSHSQHTTDRSSASTP